MTLSMGRHARQCTARATAGMFFYSTLCTKLQLRHAAERIGLS